MVYACNTQTVLCSWHCFLTFLSFSFPFSIPELLGSQWQVLGFRGGGGGKEGHMAGFQEGQAYGVLHKPTNLSSGYPTSICNFGTTHQIVLYWRHLTSTVTLQELRCHTKYLKVLNLVLNWKYYLLTWLWICVNRGMEDNVRKAFRS